MLFQDVMNVIPKDMICIYLSIHHSVTLSIYIKVSMLRYIIREGNLDSTVRRTPQLNSEAVNQ